MKDSEQPLINSTEVTDCELPSPFVVQRKTEHGYVSLKKGPIVVSANCVDEYIDLMNRKALAEKVLDGTKALTSSDRKYIYEYLTGHEAVNKKKGRPSTKRRDHQLAISFIVQRTETTKSVTRIKQELAKKFNIPGEDIEGTELRNVQDPTFYKALNRGLVSAKKDMKSFIESVEKNEGVPISENVKDGAPARVKIEKDNRFIEEILAKSKKILSWIESHQAQMENLKK